MRTVVSAITCAVILVGAAGCAGDGPDALVGSSTTTTSMGAGGGVTLGQIQQVIFTPTCAFSGCHDALTQAGGLNLQDEATSYAEMVGQPSTCAGRILVAPGDPDASYLLDKLGGGTQEPCGGMMPSELPALSASELQMIRDWIQAGGSLGSSRAAGTTTTTSTTTTLSEN